MDELLDQMVRRWIDEHIDYVGEPFWERDGDFVDIYYHWMGQSECIHVHVDDIMRFYRPPQNHHEK